MPEQGRISVLQVMLIFLVTRLVITVLLPISIVSARRDAWLGELVINLGNQLILWLHLALCARFPGQTLTQICRLLLGQYLGTFLAIIYALFFLHFTMLILRALAEFMVATIMPQTPAVVIMITMGLLVVYGARSGIEALGRTGEILSLVLVGGIVLILLMVVKDIRLIRLLPVLERGAGPLLKAGVESGIFFGEVCFLPTLAALVPNRKGLNRTLFSWLTGTGLFIALIMGITIAVFGEETASATRYAIFALARMASLGEFFDRIEPLFMTVVVSGYFIRTAIFFYASAFTAAEVTGLGNYRSLVLPLLGIAIPMMMLEWRSSTDLLDYQRYVASLLTWTMTLLMPTMLLLVALLRRAGTPIRSTCH